MKMIGQGVVAMGGLKSEGELGLGRPTLLVCIGEFVFGAGQTRVVASELEALKASFDITLVAPKVTVTVPQGIRCEVIPMGTPRGLLRLARLMRAADVVHLHDTLAHMATAYVIRRGSFIVTSHGIAPPSIRSGVAQRAKGYLTLLLYPPLYRGAQCVCTPSEYLGAWLRSLGVAEVHVIRLGAPDEVVARAEPPRERRLVYIGEVSHRKGVDLLFAGIGKCAADVQLDVVGSGDFTWAGKMLQISGAKHRVKFHGPADDVVATDLLDRALGFVSLSRWEGFGLPVVEAFARGRPAIVLDGSAMAEIVRQSGGGIVIAGPEDLPRAVATLERGWGRYSLAALKEAKRLTWASTWTRYRQLFETSLNPVRPVSL